MRVSACLSALLLSAHLYAAADSAPLTADQIMKAVAENQDRAQAERSHFIYEQSITAASRHTNGKLGRQEHATYLVTPSADGTTRKLEHIEGRYWKDHQYHDFQGEPIPDQGGIDGSITQSFLEDFDSDKSKDGLGKDLFPLTSEEQKKYRFVLEGEQTVQGRPAYRIKFAPADRNDFDWAGEALIDKEELQPVRVFTQLSRRLPFLVRNMLGTDVPGLGFNVQYKRVEKNVWFPASFGTEFRLRAVFFLNRNITVSLENKNFRKATVDSAIEYSSASEPETK